MSARAKIRDDFIRRFFAVAISVGFASTLIEMDWVGKFAFPSDSEWKQIAILATGLIATVLSWDGYLASIESKPLNGYPRFIIDILLVFIYMFFFISSKQPGFWLPILAVVFVLYVTWDFFTIKEHMGSYNKSLIPVEADDAYRAKPRHVFSVYSDGIRDADNVDRGPIITLSWATYFAILATVSSLVTAEWEVVATCLLAVAGLIIYRYDKAPNASRASGRGYSMRLRALIILLLLVLAATYFFMFRTTLIA